MSDEVAGRGRSLRGWLFAGGVVVAIGIWWVIGRPGIPQVDGGYVCHGVATSAGQLAVFVSDGRFAGAKSDGVEVDVSGYHRVHPDQLEVVFEGVKYSCDVSRLP